MTETFEFKYKVKITHIVDGDTFDADVDLGFGIFYKMRFRMFGIDTPETYGVKKTSEEYKKGLLSTNWLIEKIDGKEVILYTHKDKKGKYGRYLASVSIEGADVGAQMLKEGRAKPYE